MASRKFFLLLGVILAGCPSTGGRAGQRCSQTGAGACEGTDDGGVSPRLLVCRSSDAGPGSVWEVYSDCRLSLDDPPKGGCTVLADSSLSCDTQRNIEGDHCAPESEGLARCAPSMANILRCEGGVLTNVFDCPAGSSCARVDGGVSCL